MSNFQIVRVERLKTMAEVKRSGLHTFREIPADNAVPELKEENDIPGATNTAEKLHKAVFDRIQGLDNKDKQACRCLEFFVSASPEQFQVGGNLHDREAQDRYFENALKWIRDKHGAENVVCSVIHRDEKSPHLVVYALPVVHRKAHVRKRSVGLKGGKVGERVLIDVPVAAANELSAKAYYHCPAALALLQTEFHAGVSKEFGLERGISRAETQKHKKPARWYAEQQAALDAWGVELDQRGKELSLGQEALEEEKKRLWADLKVVASQKAVLAVALDDRAAAIKALDDRIAAAEKKGQEAQEMARTAIVEANGVKAKAVEAQTALAGRLRGLVNVKDDVPDALLISWTMAGKTAAIKRAKEAQDRQQGQGL